MFESGALGGLLAKLASMGAGAKIALAAATATATVGLGATAVVTSGSVGGASVVAHADTGGGTVQTQAHASTPVPATEAGVGGQASASVIKPTTGPPTTTTRRSVAVPGLTPTTVARPTTPLTPTGGSPTGVVPDLSALTQLPMQVMSCLAPITGILGSFMPGGAGSIGSVPSIGSLTQIPQTIVACVTGLLKNLPLPAGLSACISNILGFVNGIIANPTSMPNLSGLNVAACIPSGLPVPGVGSIPGLSGLPFFGGSGGFPFGGSR